MGLLDTGLSVSPTLDSFLFAGNRLHSGFPGGSDGKESAMQETWVQSLGWEDPLEKGMAIHTNILA